MISNLETQAVFIPGEDQYLNDINRAPHSTMPAKVFKPNRLTENMLKIFFHNSHSSRSLSTKITRETASHQINSSQSILIEFTKTNFTKLKFLTNIQTNRKLFKSH